MKVFSNRGKLLAFITLLVILSGSYGFYRYKFPYGRNHCCILQFTMALQMYAQDNKGHFPAGQSSPEASLSLLYRTQLVTAGILSGKTGSESAAKKILSNGGLLGPETCDWHYTEGLSTNDDSRIAVIWDKVGLGHDGQRSDSHEVLFVDGDRNFIPKSHWNEFLAEQQELFAMAKTRGQPILRAELGGSMSRSTGTDSPFKLFVRTHEQMDKQSFVTKSFEKPPTEQGFILIREGHRLTPAALTWYSNEVPKSGAWEMVLVVEGHYTWEVVVVFKDGKPDQRIVIFEVHQSGA